MPRTPEPFTPTQEYSCVGRNATRSGVTNEDHALLQNMRLGAWRFFLVSTQRGTRGSRPFRQQLAYALCVSRHASPSECSGIEWGGYIKLYIRLVGAWNCPIWNWPFNSVLQLPASEAVTCFLKRPTLRDTTTAPHTTGFNADMTPKSVSCPPPTPPPLGRGGGLAAGAAHWR